MKIYISAAACAERCWRYSHGNIKALNRFDLEPTLGCG